MDITIVLIRHAQHQDTGGITGGDQDPSLSENGIGEAKRLGDIFERVYPNTYHIVYHSGMERAKQTAELAFAGKDVEYKALRKLKEIRHRLTEGMKPEERDAMWKDFVADEIKKWKEEHPGEEIDP